ncbi:MAG: hypothetical protein ABL984_12600 [Pyrinomonadaceae bacterium]
MERFAVTGMLELTPELQAKLAKFRDSYEWALVWLADAVGDAESKHRDAWASASRDVPLSEVEEELFRRLVKEEASSEPLFIPHLHRSPAIPIPSRSASYDHPEPSDPPPIPKPQ